MNTLTFTAADARRSFLAVSLMVAVATALAMSGLGDGGAGSVAVPLADMKQAFGVSTAAAAGVWAAFNSWWSWALAAATLAIGLGGFSVLIKSLFKGWVKTYGKKVAGEIAVSW